LVELRRIAVLNRAEAATRCIRAIAELREQEGSDLVAIALYTEPDRFAPFVREADEAINLGPALRRTHDSDGLRVAYLDHDRVLAALRAARADAVWPGWGFLAEDPSFVEKLEAAELVFMGPSAATMRRLGDKISSKLLAESAKVPVAAWSGGPLERDQVEAAAGRIGFPLMLKATAGGGGRGIRKVRCPEDLLAAFDSARAEAAAAFGDGTLFAEAAIEGARHVEVQMAADRHGRVLAVGMRDCSVQRKHQKLIEEGPPPGLSRELRREMRDASVRLLREAEYVGVATCEYLVRDGSFYFLEVNPRLQVEHGVTEMLTDWDLVKTQIRIARGQRLPRTAPAERGHCIEVRLCAEDPANSFAPSPGEIALLDLSSGPGVRVDSGIATAGSIPGEFDSMVAKILARGATREEARARLVRALRDSRVVVSGGMTNKGFLLDVLDHPEFRAGGIDTGWLDRASRGQGPSTLGPSARGSDGGRSEPQASGESGLLASAPEPSVPALLVAAILSYQREREKVRANFYAEAARGRARNIPASMGMDIDLVAGGVPYRLRVFAIGGWAYRVHQGERVAQVTLLEQGPHTFALLWGSDRYDVLASETEVELRIELDGRLHAIRRDVGGKVRAPSPALLIEVAVAPGDRVTAGQRLGLFEAMKTETAFFAPVSGQVREVLARAGERVQAGDVILVIEPSGDGAEKQGGAALELPESDDPLDLFFAGDGPDLARADDAPAALRANAVNALRTETRRILMGYDVNEARADQLVAVLEADLPEISDAFRAELAQLANAVQLFADIERLFSRAPTRLASDALGPSNDARMAMYLRRIAAQGAGIAPEFLEMLRETLGEYGLATLAPCPELERALLRLWATRTTLPLRTRLMTALLDLLIRLGERGERFARHPELHAALDRLALLRESALPAVADLAAQARFRLFERADAAPAEPPAPVDLSLTLVPPPDPAALDALARELGIEPARARELELWRLANFELEPLDTEGFHEICAFLARARDHSGDERILCFAEVRDLGRGVPARPDLAKFEARFREAIEAMRALQARTDPEHRMQWNRLVLYLRPPIVLSDELLAEAMRRLAPETGHLGLERVLVRLASVDPELPGDPPRPVEIIASNPSGGRVEWSFREPHRRPLEPATPYVRRLAQARARGLIDPYEVARLFTAPVQGEVPSLGAPLGPGHFEEFELVDGRALPVERAPGANPAGVVFGVIRTETRKHPEGMRRVLVVSDPTKGMGALAAPECDRIVAAIDLAERERIPVEWVAVSSGARIAMDSGTENLDATARVVRRLVTFTDAGGEVNVILAGTNVGAQSYFDALATMGLQTRGILVMLPSSSMVLTGRAALEVSGGVAAEDENAIGGYERIMGPNGEAQYQARDLADAYALLLEHYATSYVAPGEPGPRAFETKDPLDRDITLERCEGEEGFATLGEIFSEHANPERKRPFAMRPLMRALVDSDAGWLERWRDWAGAETAIVWDAHLGGQPVTLIGIESRSVPRTGYVPNDGPDAWTPGTLFPYSSKKVARALNAASGNRPAVILANLSGFDGSPESMRRGVLEWGAEIARAVVRFRGRIVFAVVTRYHGGAYVVFSRELNPEMRAVALQGSFASVIGGSAAAAVVFPREVRKRANADPRVAQARAQMERASDPAERMARRARLEALQADVMLEKQAEVAAEFDAIHSVERALRVGSLETLLEPRHLRPSLIAWLRERS
jgi:acetyl/propionyl-CoA carboxylase alpha subunit/acetyl-CoA carboxylase carboxyltransferase component